jgi:hypothetical protein
MSIKYLLQQSFLLILVLGISNKSYATGDGLLADYWNFDVVDNGYNFPTSGPTITRVDSTVDFDWDSQSPAAGDITTDDFSVRWQGEIEIIETGNYTFSTESDDGVRLWVDEQLIINNWTRHSASWDQSAPISLTAGQRYAIKMEFFENGGRAVARLHWQTPSNNTRLVIPQSQLYSQGANGPGPVSCSLDQIATDGEEFRGIAGSSDNNVIAVGHSGSFYHYDGTSWSLRPETSDEDLHAVSVISTNLAYAAGHNGRVLRFDGTSWSNFTSTASDKDLNDIEAESDSDIWAVGKSDTLEYWNGSTWTDMSGSGEANVDNGKELRSSWADAANFYTVEKDGDIYHYTKASQTWNKISTCSDAFDDMDAKGLWGDGAGNIYITGQDKDPSPKEASIFRYNEGSNSCSKVFSTTTEDKFEAISGYGSVIYAVGKDGLVATNASGSWVESVQGSEDWKAVWVSNTETPYYAGKDGYITTCSLPAPLSPDHLSISHDGSAINCLSETITISGHDSTHNIDTAYNGTVALSTNTNHGNWSFVSGSGGIAANLINSGSGVGSYSFDGTENGSVTLGLFNTFAEVVNINVSDGTVTETSGSADAVTDDADLEYEAAGFVFDVPPLTACKPSANVTIKAVKQGSNTTQCVSALTGNKTLSFWSDYDIPASGSNQVQINGTNIAASSTGTNINLTFDINGEAQFTTQYDDAGRLNLTANYDDGNGLLMTGSDLFISKPVALVTYSSDSSAACASQDASCSQFKKAGETFDLKVNAACWTNDADTNFTDNPTTPNFELASIGINHAVAAPTGGVNGQLGQNSFNFSTTNAGTHTIQQTLSEVGVFTFDIVAPAYLGEILNTTTSASIGRFYPDHFEATTASNGSFGNNACTGFSYSGQDFAYLSNPQLLVTAYSASSPATVTQNYRGTFAKLTDTDFTVTTPTADANQLGADNTNLVRLIWQAAAPSLADNNNGSLTFAFGNDNYTYRHEANSEVGPFNNTVDLTFTAITDSDNVSTSTLPHTLQASGEPIRFGRIAIDSAHGSELAPLTVGLRTEFFNGSDWLPNTQDQCTSLSLNTQLRLKVDNGSFQTGNSTIIIQTGTTSATLANPVISGNGSLSLSAPGEDNQGYIDIRSNISTTHPWLLGDYDNSGVYNDEAQSRASFGLFKGSDNIIFRRERY